jgi:MFS transporter, DHA1 family, inner membrane transport protein
VSLPVAFPAVPAPDLTVSSDAGSSDAGSSDAGSSGGTPRAFGVLTVTKLVANFALRLGYPFNTDIAKGLHVSLTAVGRLQGTGELFGLGAVFAGRALDRGRYRTCAVLGTALFGVGAMVLGFRSSTVSFAIGFALIALGVPVMTTATHTWIGATIPYERRGRVVGIYETTWAVALLVGAPITGLMIDRLRWWSPFFMFGLLAVVLLPMLWRTVPNGAVPNGAVPTLTAAGVTAPRERLVISSAVVAIVVCVVALTMTGVLVFATFGAWLKDRHGFSTAGVAALAFALGAAELAGSVGTAVITDRIGKRVAIASGCLVMMVGLVVMLASRSSTPAAVVGIVTVFGGFEFAFVSHFPVITEVGGAARGTLLSASGALITGGRAVGVVAGTSLYESYGMAWVLGAAMLAGLIAAAAVGFLPKDEHHVVASLD